MFMLLETFLAIFEVFSRQANTWPRSRHHECTVAEDGKLQENSERFDIIDETCNVLVS